MKRAAFVIMAAILMPMTTHAAEIPVEIREAAEEIGEQYDVSPALIEAICYEESRFTADIKNASGKNYGLMQINPSFNKDRMERLGVSKEELLTIRGNILVATDLLAELFAEYEDPVDVILVYGGFSQAKRDKYHKDGTIPAYINKLLVRARNYEQAQEKEETEDANR